MYFDPAHGGAVLPVHHDTPTVIDGHASAAEILKILQNTAIHGNGWNAGAKADLINVGGGGGGYYDDWSADSGWFCSDDYAGYDGNAVSDGVASSTPETPDWRIGNEIFGVTADGQVHTVAVTYNYITSDHLNGDQPVTQKIAAIFTDVVGATPGVNSVDVSATTNGHEHEIAPHDHLEGRAVDIDTINGVAVSKDGPGAQHALALEAQALANPNTRYVEGPGGNWWRSAPGGQWQPSAHLATSDRHVHFATFAN